MNISEFNYIEAAVWVLVSGALFFSALKEGRGSPYFKTAVVACISFAAFGVSDIIEAQTGAWWRPVGLLALKATCVVLFVGCYYNYIKVKRAKT